MRRAFTILAALIVSIGLGVIPVFATEAPVITLDRVEVATIQPFFAKPRVGFKSEKEPGQELAVGGILSLAYILNIKNPNKQPIMLDELSFTASFEGFDVNTAMVYEDSWIPAGKSNQLRVVVANEVLPTLGSLMVGAENAAKLKEMNTNAAAIVKKWWDTVGDFDFPITLSNGTALFKDEKGKEIQATFTGKWPQK
jgi:hypothetical protein